MCCHSPQTRLQLPRTLGLRWIGKSVFRFNLKSGFRISDFAIEREIRKRILPPRNPSSGCIPIKKSKSGFHGFPFYHSIRKSVKGFAKLLSWTAVFFATYAYASKTVVLKDSFSSLFSDFPVERTKWKSKNRYLSVEIRFRISRSISNPKSGF